MRRSTAALLVGLTLFAGSTLPRLQAQSGGGLRVLSREGVRMLSTVTANAQEYVALDEVATAFGLTLREDRLAGGLTVTAGNRSVIVTPDQAVVSVSGRLVSLSAPPLRQGARWLMPLDVLQRAIGPLLDMRMELRRSSRLLVVGDLRVPRVSARVDSTPSGTTIVFDASPSAAAKVTAEAGRVLVTFDADLLDLALPSFQPTEFLQAIQAGDAAAAVRLVTGPKFGVHRATNAQPDAATSRLTIELLPTTTDTAAPIPPSAAPGAAPVDPLPLPLPTTGMRTIVIDPGHGGDESGARGSGGVLEKDITLAVSRRLRTMIESRLGLRVFLTRDDDRRVSLDDRAAYANSQRADLFLSVHANASLRPTMKGAEVYFLSRGLTSESDTRDEGASATLPALGGGARIIDLVPWESAQSRYLNQSSAFAGTIEQTLRARVEMSARAVQQAPFRVLVGAGMPAVLVELGYLSNPEQEQLLSTSAAQDQLAQALFDGIVQFRAQTERGTPAVAPPVTATQ